MSLPLPGPTILASFVLASCLLILAPGPATFFVLARARTSVRDAAAAVTGIVLGDVVLIGVAGLGFAAVIARWPLLLVVLKVAGALYVAWLGLGLLRSKTGAEPASQSGGVLRGFLLTLGNPKAIIFFAAFFPLFIDDGPGHSQAAGFYALGVVFELLNLVYFSLLTLAVRGVGRLGVRPPAALTLNRISGWGLLACAALLLVSLFDRL